MRDGHDDGLTEVPRRDAKGDLMTERCNSLVPNDDALALLGLMTPAPQGRNGLVERDQKKKFVRVGDLT
eukprot:scaffold238401_cov30-Tisochrysis_lutea.AAC.3